MSVHLKTAWDHIRRAPFQALAAVFVLMTTFFVVTILTTLVYSSSQILRYFETRPQVISFLKDEVAPEKIAELKSKLESDTRVKDVRLVSKEEALEIYKKATSDNPLLSELVSPSIFPASLEFSLTDLSFAQEIIDGVKKEEIVDQVGFTASLGTEDSLSDVVNRLRTITWYIRLGGGAFAVLLAATSFLILFIIIGMRMTMRREEVEVLGLIGATSGFIRSPIILEAIIYVVLGVFSGWFLAFILILYSTPTLINYFREIPILPKDTFQLFTFFLAIFGAELLVGLVLGLLGSIMAISRVKKIK